MPLAAELSFSSPASSVAALTSNFLGPLILPVLHRSVMTRLDRLIGIASFVVAISALFALIGLAGGNIGPFELAVIVILALPLSVLVFRLVRTATGHPHRQP